MWQRSPAVLFSFQKKICPRTIGRIRVNPGTGISGSPLGEEKTATTITVCFSRKEVRPCPRNSRQVVHKMERRLYSVEAWPGTETNHTSSRVCLPPEAGVYPTPHTSVVPKEDVRPSAIILAAVDPADLWTCTPDF